MKTILEVKDLKISYKVKQGYLSAVNNLSIKINEGEVYALVGESGCGKSTVAYSIMRLLMSGNEKITGEINYKSRDILALSEREVEAIRGKEIGMIFQNPLDSLNPVYKTGAQVLEAMKLDSDKKCSIEDVIQLYENVKIPNARERINAFAHELSGGMRQRVMIAMMMAREPNLLVADEPTTALDVTVEARILSIMKEFCSKMNASILLITHNFGIVAEIADKIGIMYAGELVEEADVATIFKNPKHPYAVALMSSLLNCSKKERRVATIKGSVPRILEGEEPLCRFSNRCHRAEEICFQIKPQLVEIEPSHFVRCHLEVKHG